MTDALRLTLTQDRPKPVVCLVRFHGELKAEHRKVLAVDSPSHEIGAHLDVLRDEEWVRCEIVGKDRWAIVVAPRSDYEAGR